MKRAIGIVIELSKIRIAVMATATALMGYVLAALGLSPDAMLPLAGVFLLACGAGALNQVQEPGIDARMDRTRNRPIPSGRIDVLRAALIALLLLGAGLACLSGSREAVALGVLTVAWYNGVYTYLKRTSPFAAIPGGVVGSLPPVIGWAAVTGSVSVEPLILFLIIFMWTPPHFWALALYRNGDYEKAGVPMMPVVAGKQSTRAQMLLYTLLLAPVTLMPALLGYAGLAYGAVAAIASALFVGFAAEVWLLGKVAKGAPQGELRADRAARRLFAYSIFYLFILFLALLAEQLLGWA